MSYQQPNQPNYQYPAAPAQGGVARAPQPPIDDGLDAIPMQKTRPGLIIAIVVGLGLVVGVTAWATMGGKKTSAKEIEQMKAQAAQSGGTGMSLADQKEHLAMTQRAMEKFQAEEKQAQAAEAAKKAADDEEKKKTEAAKAGGGGPAPVSGAAAKKASSGLDSIGADYASKLGGN